MPATAFTDLSTSLLVEVSKAITGALPVAAVVLGAYIGFRIYKHFVKG